MFLYLYLRLWRWVMGQGIGRFWVWFCRGVEPVCFVICIAAGDVCVHRLGWYWRVLSGLFMAAFLLGSLATVIVALLVAKFFFRLDLAQTTFHGFLAIYANSGYMGIPLFIVAFGVDKIFAAIIITTVGPMMFIAVVMLAMELMRSPDKPMLGRIWSVALMLMKSPMLVASVLGVVFSAYSIPLPISIGNLLDLLASLIFLRWTRFGLSLRWFWPPCRLGQRRLQWRNNTT